LLGHSKLESTVRYLGIEVDWKTLRVVAEPGGANINLQAQTLSALARCSVRLPSVPRPQRSPSKISVYSEYSE